MIQNGKLVSLMEWDACEEVMVKVYKPGLNNDWSGLLWQGNTSHVPQDSPQCGWDGELCDSDTGGNISHNIIILTVIGISCLCTVLVSGWSMKKYKYEMALKGVHIVTVKWEEVELVENMIEDDDSEMNTPNNIGVYQGEYCEIQTLGNNTFSLEDRNVLIDIKEMRELVHENMNIFVGICIESPHSCILMGAASRGCLCKVLKNSTLDWYFKASFILDIACGMAYLHQSPICVHGHLTSSTCIVDSRWSCKVTGHGLAHVRKVAQNQVYMTKYQSDASELLWTAPELLRSTGIKGSMPGDVFSFAIVAQEVILWSTPYQYNEPVLSHAAIIEAVKKGSNPPSRPSIPAHSCSKEWGDLVKDCWKELPENRPTFGQILSVCFNLNKRKDISLVDNIIQRLAFYTRKLEEKVADRARELVEEKAKVERILSELLPLIVAQNLSMGEQVKPETFNNVTIFFSDIVGFTHLCSQLKALQIVNMLAEMYTMFDDIAEKFDVYKVATIGDAYMVASGIPIRNGDKHAKEICGMALALVKGIAQFRIHSDIKEDKLFMRVGVHSGPCVAGVVGIKMPRYFLFGDTVDTASRMESRGEAMKVHISENTKILIEDNLQFKIERRGNIIESKMIPISTYWLSGR